jgi:TRAP-type C4-dicarboxylate transport system permease small subunit
MKIWMLIKKLWVNLLLLLNNIASIAIFLMALLITADVIGRFVLNKPLPGTTELVKSALAAIVFLALAYTLQQGRHVRTTVFLKLLSPICATLVNAVASFIGAVIFALMCRYSWDPAWVGWSIREYEGVQLQVPVYPIRFIIVLASGIVALQFIIEMIGNIHVLATNRRGDT